MKKIAICSILIGLCVPLQSWAGNARGYKPFPEGTFLFCTYFKHFSANNMYAANKKISSDLNLSSNIGIFRPVYYKKIGKALYGEGDFIVNPQIFMMFGDRDMALGGEALSDSGFFDPMILATFWFVSAPEKKLWIGFSPYVTIPVGSYHTNRSLNLGENRWTIKPEIGIVKGFGEDLFLDFIMNIKFHADNDEFFSGQKRVKKSQSDLFGLETHLSYNLKKEFFVSLDYFFNSGGETEIDGIRKRDKQENHAIGASMFWSLKNNQQIMIEYLNNFDIESGAKTQTLGIRWSYFL
ncbi:transporter [Syntrophotalea acetylenica]|uniref:transporter n=1 Tax=Syntrophotalea acetylenica TaxID=29542 RepID=UPI001314B7F6|nr:transporter [Syntrophotalea acetylenica]